jgi:hypothetical protein
MRIAKEKPLIGNVKDYNLMLIARGVAKSTMEAGPSILDGK